MDLTRVIIASIVTEKAEREKAKARHTYTLHVAPTATKIEIEKALERFFDVEVASVRITRVQPKSRLLSAGRPMEKRKSFKKAYVTLAPKSKALDLTAFQSHS